MNVNHSMLSGNLTRDPAMRFFPDNRNVASFTIAQHRRYTKSNGEQVDETLFIDCEAWGKTADLVGKYCTKGKAVMVEAALRQDSWTDKDGQSRTKIKLVAERVHFLPDGRRPGAPGAAEGTPAAGTEAAPAPAPRGDDEPPF